MSQTPDHKSLLAGIFAREYTNLLGYVRSSLPRVDEITAEDVVQDVALNFFSRGDFDSPVQNLLAYLYRSLKNRMIDLARKRKDVLLSEYDDVADGSNLLLETFISEPSDPEDALQQEKDMELLFRAIDRLRPDEQGIIEATELEGVTFRELSEKWDLPVGTLLSRKHRALNRLRKIILEEKETNQTKRRNNNGKHFRKT
jgi:RNA polymerase sigma factor (sigma-70 family)